MGGKTRTRVWPAERQRKGAPVRLHRMKVFTPEGGVMIRSYIDKDRMRHWRDYYLKKGLGVRRI